MLQSVSPGWTTQLVGSGDGTDAWGKPDATGSRAMGAAQCSGRATGTPREQPTRLVRDQGRETGAPDGRRAPWSTFALPTTEPWKGRGRAPAKNRQLRCLLTSFVISNIETCFL